MRTHSYNMRNLWSKDPAELERKLQMLARRDAVDFTELFCWNNNRDGWPVVTPEVIKALHPSVKVYYHAVVAQKIADTDWDAPHTDTRIMQCPMTYLEIDENDWWLRDTAGNKVGSQYGCWLDVAKPGFKEAFLAALLRRMEGHPYDGVSFESWPETRGGEADATYFEQGIRPLTEYVTGELHTKGYCLIAGDWAADNTTTPNKEWLRSHFDGTIYEQGAVGWSDSGGAWLSGAVIDARIKALGSDPLEVWLSDEGLRRTDPQYDRKALISLALYYLGLPMRGAARYYNHYYDASSFWNPVWDMDLGEPVAPTVKSYGAYRWYRSFERGRVVMNYTGAAYNHSLPVGEWKRLDGSVATAYVRVAPMSAEILQRVGV